MGEVYDQLHKHIATVFRGDHSLGKHVEQRKSVLEACIFPSNISIQIALVSCTTLFGDL